MVVTICKANLRQAGLPAIPSEKDLPLAKALASTAFIERIIIEGNLTSREAIKLGGADLLIGMRLHALILAAICGVPFVALPYDPKVNAFLDLVEIDNYIMPEELTFQNLLANLKVVLYQKKKVQIKQVWSLKSRKKG